MIWIRAMFPGVLLLFFLAVSAAWAGDDAEPTPSPAARCRSAIGAGPAIPFPDLGMMMAEAQGIQRPPRPPLKPLPPFDPTAPSLAREVLEVLVGLKGRYENWKTVAYAASGHRTLEDKLRASWARDDLAADLRDSFAQLNETQIRIVDAAFRRGMADQPPLAAMPNEVTLEWVKKTFPHVIHP